MLCFSPAPAWPPVRFGHFTVEQASSAQPLRYPGKVGRGLTSRPRALSGGKSSSPNWNGSPLLTLPRQSMVLPPPRGCVFHQQAKTPESLALPSRVTRCLILRVFGFVLQCWGWSPVLTVLLLQATGFLLLLKFPGALGYPSQSEFCPKS